MRGRAARYEDAIQAAYATPIDPSTFPIGSPWSSSNLQRIVAEDVFGTDLPINTRAAAMQIPPIARGRNLIVNSSAVNPLVAMRVDQPLPIQPSWLMTTAGGSSPQLRNAWTVDDLIFYGWSCWSRVNGADRFPISATRVPMGDWDVNADYRVEINGVVQDDDAVILIPGVHEGILTYGSQALADIRTLYTNVRKRLANPIPAVDLHQTGGREMTDDEIDAFIERWAAARAGVNGGVGFTSPNLEARVLAGSDDGQLMIESRNAAAVEAARMLGISAGLLDATTPKASLNYETTSGRNEEFIDRDLSLYMNPIAWRLSMDDVCPHGQRIAWDTSAFTSPTWSPTGPTLED